MRKTKHKEAPKRIEVFQLIISEKWYLQHANIKKVEAGNLKNFVIVDQLVTYQRDLDRFYNVNFNRQRVMR